MQQVLVVEDEPILGELCCLQIQRTLGDIKAERVGSLERARKWLDQCDTNVLRAAVIDRDIVFGHDGLELVQPIRQHPAFASNGRIIVWSSHDDAESIAEARTAGADGFLSKRRSSRAGVDIKQMLDRCDRGETWVVIR
jgi:DNA-binding NarL/FixJ family response regulator